MASKTYLWIEDRKGKSGHTFWKTLMNYLCPSVIVESKKNNSELVKAVASLQDDGNTYIIIFDNSFDNLHIYQEQKRLKQYAELKKNVKLLDFICFEYILLEFDQLLYWIFAPEDELLEKRFKAVAARNKLVNALKCGEMDYKLFREIVEYDTNLENHNIEQLSAKLLFDLTRNTGFEVSKGKIGDCWLKSCCEWAEKQEDDMCGLNTLHLSAKEKMKAIYDGTSLREKLPKTGLEVSAC